MKPPLATAALRRSLALDLAGIDAAIARARQTRRADLGRVLGYAAGRRLLRAGAPVAGRSGSDAVRTPAPERSGTRAGEATLLERAAVAADLLRLTLSRPADFRYAPGQHVKVGLAGLMRNYSLVSAPHQRHLELFVELFPGGRLSERLRGVQPGAALRIAARAKGNLSADPGYPTQLMIATVTGIAPYVSILRDHVHRAAARPARFVIVHGASFADELGYADELEALARRRPDLVAYVPTVSRPENARNAGWRGARGRVETQVEPVLARFGLTPADTAVFACGQPDMVRRIAADLRRRGFTTQTEPFD